MRILLAASVLVLMISPVALGQRTQTVEADRIETIRLDENGEARLRLSFERASQPGFDLFSGPAGVGELSLVLDTGDADDKSAASASRVLAPGRHDFTLTAPDPETAGNAEIQGRIRLDPPLDAFEPNDRLEDAVPIEIPFHQIIRLSGGDWDWFEVEAPGSGVIGIHLHGWRGGYSGPQIQVLDARGEQVLLTGTASWAWQGMRYVRARGGRLHIGVTDSNTWSDSDDGGFKALEIVHYLPMERVNGSLITLGLDGEDPSFFQLDLVGEAVGQDVHTADEAEAVAAELTRAVEAGLRRGLSAWMWILILLVLAGGGAGSWWYFRRKRMVETPETPPQE